MVGFSWNSEHFNTRKDYGNILAMLKLAWTFGTGKCKRFISPHSSSFPLGVPAYDIVTQCCHLHSFTPSRTAHCVRKNSHKRIEGIGDELDQNTLCTPMKFSNNYKTHILNNFVVLCWATSTVHGFLGAHSPWVWGWAALKTTLSD